MEEDRYLRLRQSGWVMERLERSSVLVVGAGAWQGRPIWPLASSWGGSCRQLNGSTCCPPWGRSGR